MQQINPPLEQHLNAAQMAAVQHEVQRVVAGLKLRQWVVEQVLTHCADEHPMRLVRDLYTFIIGTEEPEEE